MKTSLAVRLEELIRGTDDKKFSQIYKDLLDFKKIHFIEFKIINRISLLNDLVNIIEDEMEVREHLAIVKVRDGQDSPTKAKQEPTKPLVTEDWKQQWIEENEEPKKTSKGSDFRLVFLYVIIAHVLGFVFMWGYNQYRENLELRIQKDLQASASIYPAFPEYKKSED